MEQRVGLERQVVERQMGRRERQRSGGVASMTSTSIATTTVTTMLSNTDAFGMQRMTVAVNGREHFHWPVSTGVGGTPSGTVTLLFTDIEGSTRLWEAHPDAMREALARHDDLAGPGAQPRRNREL